MIAELILSISISIMIFSVTALIILKLFPSLHYLVYKIYLTKNRVRKTLRGLYDTI